MHRSTTRLATLFATLSATTVLAPLSLACAARQEAEQSHTAKARIEPRSVHEFETNTRGEDGVERKVTLRIEDGEVTEATVDGAEVAADRVRKTVAGWEVVDGDGAVVASFRNPRFSDARHRMVVVEGKKEHGDAPRRIVRRFRTGGGATAGEGGNEVEIAARIVVDSEDGEEHGDAGEASPTVRIVIAGEDGEVIELDGLDALHGAGGMEILEELEGAEGLQELLEQLGHGEAIGEIELEVDLDDDHGGAVFIGPDGRPKRLGMPGGAWIEAGPAGHAGSIDALPDGLPKEIAEAIMGSITESMGAHGGIAVEPGGIDMMFGPTGMMPGGTGMRGFEHAMESFMHRMEMWGERFERRLDERLRGMGGGARGAGQSPEAMERRIRLLEAQVERLMRQIERLRDDDHDDHDDHDEDHDDGDRANGR